MSVFTRSTRSSAQSASVIVSTGRFEAKRPPTLVGPPEGGRAATFVPYVQHQTLLSSLSYNPAYVPGSKFGFVKLLISLDPHCTQKVDEQHRPAGFKSWLVPNLPLPFIPTLIGLRAFDLVSSPAWWEAATNTGYYLLFAFSSVKPFSFIRSIDVPNT